VTERAQREVGLGTWANGPHIPQSLYLIFFLPKSWVFNCIHLHTPAAAHGYTYTTSCVAAGPVELLGDRVVNLSEKLTICIRGKVWGFAVKLHNGGVG
jgi:hypothetical protein